MSESLATIEFALDPAFPWSLPRVGLPLLAIVAVVIAVLTVWTYRGVAGASPPRVLTLLLIRLIALALALFTVARPSLLLRDDLQIPSLLLVLIDGSRSMDVRDEVANRSRWDTVKQLLARCQPQLDALKSERNVTVSFQRFDERLSEWDAEKGLPDGSRTDTGTALHDLFERHGAERALRGLLILSDGADNGARYSPAAEAARWRGVQCPISTFVVGRRDTSAQQRDLALTSLTPEPSPVPIKAKLSVKAMLDAPGFENARVMLRLFIDGKEVAQQEATPTKSSGNEVRIQADAPATPGEVKLTLKVDPLPGEATVTNNEISTYLTVTREGLSVLVIDRLRLELKFARRALAGDPRFRVYEAIRQTDAAGGRDPYNLDTQQYDVIVIGDVSARRVTGGDPQALAKIEKMVRERGAGLLMMGGEESFAAGGWAATPVGNMLPVQLDARGQSEERARMVPTDAGKTEYLMRLNADPKASEDLWRKLPALSGYSRLGRRKDGATLLAATPGGEPLLAKQVYGKGRVVALAADTTFQWQELGQTAKPRTRDGIEAHARFWKQLMVYLAQQEEQEGTAYVRPDSRRLSAGAKLGFGVGLKGKTGVDMPGGQWEIRVEGPDGANEVVPVSQERDGQRGSFWKTDKPGEYRIVAKGSGKDIDGKELGGEAAARFVVYRDEAELLRQAADPDFLQRLSQAGGGKALRADDLPKFLDDLMNEPLPQGKQKPRAFPDWRRTSLTGFPPTLLLLFALLLGTEWGLRRWWGLV